MKTVMLKIDSDNIEQSKINQACEILKSGGLVAFPTETVYGLGGNALEPQAAGRIYAAKGRPSDNPLIVHIANEAMLEELVEEISEKAKLLSNHFWPGPLTMIFRKKRIIPNETTGGMDTVGIRMPSHPVALALIEQSGVAVAAPSANASGKPSPTRAKHVLEDLDGRIDMILDGDDAQIGLESTIVDTTCEPPVLLRPGFVTREMLEKVIGPVDVDPAVYEKVENGVKPKAPGMKYRHYAPKAELTLFRGDMEKVTRHINKKIEEDICQGRTPGVFVSQETRKQYEKGVVLCMGTRSDEETIAHCMYDVLREFDRLNVDVIYGEAFEQDNLGQAIMNRLIKAAGYKIVDIG